MEESSPLRSSLKSGLGRPPPRSLMFSQDSVSFLVPSQSESALRHRPHPDTTVDSKKLILRPSTKIQVPKTSVPFFKPTVNPVSSLAANESSAAGEANSDWIPTLKFRNSFLTKPQSLKINPGLARQQSIFIKPQQGYSGLGDRSSLPFSLNESQLTSRIRTKTVPELDELPAPNSNPLSRMAMYQPIVSSLSQNSLKALKLSPFLLPRATLCPSDYLGLAKELSSLLLQQPKTCRDVHQAKQKIMENRSLCQKLASCCCLTLLAACHALFEENSESSFKSQVQDLKLSIFERPDSSTISTEEFKMQLFEEIVKLLRPINQPQGSNLFSLIAITNCWESTYPPKVQEKIWQLILIEVPLVNSKFQLQEESLVLIAKRLQASDLRHKDKIFYYRVFLSAICSSNSFRLDSNTPVQLNYLKLLGGAFEACFEPKQEPNPVLHAATILDLSLVSSKETDNFAQIVMRCKQKLPSHRDLSLVEIEQETIHDPSTPEYISSYLIRSTVERFGDDLDAMRDYFKWWFNFSQTQRWTNPNLFIAMAKRISKFPRHQIFMDVVRNHKFGLLNLVMKLLYSLAFSQNKGCQALLISLLKIWQSLMNEQLQIRPEPDFIDLVLSQRSQIEHALLEIQQMEQNPELAGTISKIPASSAFFKHLETHKVLLGVLPRFKHALEILLDPTITIYSRLKKEELFALKSKLQSSKQTQSHNWNDIVSSFGSNESLIRSVDLLSIPKYTECLLKKMPLHGKAVELSDFNLFCFQAEEELKAILKTPLDHIERKQLEENWEFIESLEKPTTQEILHYSQFVEQGRCKTIIGNFKAARLILLSPRLKESAIKLKDYLSQRKLFAEDQRITDFITACETALANSDNFKFSVSQRTLQSLSDNYTDTIAVMHSLADLWIALGNCVDLMAHFFDKDNSHFQDMICSEEIGMTIGAEVANSVLQLVTIVRGFRSKVGLISFVQVFYNQSHNFLVHPKLLSQHSHQLIDVSKALMSETNADGVEAARKILNKSVIVFQVDEPLTDYSVHCSVDKGISDANKIMESLRKNEILQKERKSGGNSRSEVVESSILLEKLLDLKHKVKLGVGESEKSGKGGIDWGEFDGKAFVSIVSGVERMLKSLVSIVRSGTVYNLTPLILQKLKSIDKSSSLKKDAESINTGVFTENKLSLAIQTNSNVSREPGQLSNHFQILANVLESIEEESKNIFFSKHLRYHNITLLKSAQSIKLSNYFFDQSIEESSTSPISCEALLMTKQMFPSNKLEPKSVINAKKQSSTQTSQAGYVLDVLAIAIDNLKQIQPEIKAKPIVFEDIPADKQPNKKISFIATTESERFKNLERLRLTKRAATFGPEQITCGTYNTTKHDLQNFVRKALTDSDKALYVLMDLNLVAHEAWSSLVASCQEFLSQPHLVSNTNLFIFVVQEEGKPSDLYTALKSKPQFFTEEFIRAALSEKLALPIEFEVFTSDCAGLGKTTSIRKRAGTRPLYTMFLCGDMTQNESSNRFHPLIEAVRSGAEFCLCIKLDTMDNMTESCRYVDQILFYIVHLRHVPVDNTEFTNLNKMKMCLVEVQNSYRDLILRKITMLNFANRIHINAIKENEFNSRVGFPCWTSAECQQTNQSICYHDSVRYLNRFWMALNNKSYGKKPLSTDGSAAGDSNLVQNLCQMLKSSNTEIHFDSFLRGFTFHHLKNFVCSLCCQIKELEEIPSLNPRNHQGRPADFMTNLQNIRLSLATQTIKLTSNLVFDVTVALTKESDRAQAIFASSLQAGTDAVTRELQEYSRMVALVPKWEVGHQVNFFFYQGGMKVIYKDLARVDANIKEIVLNQTRKGLQDFQSLRSSNTDSYSNALIAELLEALDLRGGKGHLDTINKEPRYMMLKTSEERVLEYYKNKFENFHDNKGYKITHDNLPKILMIFQRALLGIPIVIMGATGCGKTYMLEFISSCLLGDTFVCFTLHTGVSEQQLVDILLSSLIKAEQNPQKRVWLFFDEFNTSPLQCFISEAMIERKSTFHSRLAGKMFPINLIFVAACNPFRIKPSVSSLGLIDVKSTSILSHRVYPIPSSLMYYVLDFGKIPAESEKDYIVTMAPFCNIPEAGRTPIQSKCLAAIETCQVFFRADRFEGSVSLRDVKRFFTLLEFTNRFHDLTEETSLALATSINYVFRLETSADKAALLRELDSKLRLTEPFSQLADKALTLIAQDIKQLGAIDKTTSLNRPLKENLVALWVCIMTKIPIIICGKPGTSKSLSMRNLSDTLGLSPEMLANSRFFRSAPKMHYVKFWGSNSTTSESIQASFDKAEDTYDRLNRRPAGTAQQLITDTNVCFVFDEIGLAEMAPTNPLKILHPLLEPEVTKVSFVGFSNYKLDCSKTNRAVSVGRPDQDAEDLIDTCDLVSFQKELSFTERGKRIASIIQNYFQALATSYTEFRRLEMEDTGSTPNFHGSRDFYETVRIFKRYLMTMLSQPSHANAYSDPQLLYGLMSIAIQRNFSGKVMQGKLCYEMMMEQLDRSLRANHKTPLRFQHSIDLIYQNLVDTECRHLMVLSSNSTVEDILVGMMKDYTVKIKRKEPDKFVYLSCGQNKQADTLKTIESELPYYIAHGYTVVMKNLWELYGSMYDLLNRNYSKLGYRNNSPVMVDQPIPGSELGENRFTCEISWSGYRKKVVVHPEFKVVVLMDESVQGRLELAQQRRDPPFMNRFEKILIKESDYIMPEHKTTLDKLIEEYGCNSSDGRSPTEEIPRGALVHNLSKDLIYSTISENKSFLTQVLKGESTELGIVQILQRALMVAVHQPKQPQSRDSESLSRNIQTKLTKLHSRNRLFAYLLGRLPHTSGQYEQSFYECHPYNSLTQLLEAMHRRTVQRKALVYTYTSLVDLRILASSSTELFTLREFNELQGLSAGDQMIRIQAWLNESTSRPLVLQFTKKSDWTGISAVKTSFEKVIQQTNASKPVVFVAQYLMGDFQPQNSHYTSGITFFDEEWETTSIDDLRGCNHREFANLLNNDCEAEFKVRSKTNPPENIIKKYFIGLVDHESKLQRLEIFNEIFERCRDGVRAILDASQAKIGNNKLKVKGLLSTLRLNLEFQLQQDAKAIVDKHLQNYFEQSVSEIFSSVAYQINLNCMFAVSAFRSTDHRQEIFTSLGAKITQLLQGSPSRSANLFDVYQSIIPNFAQLESLLKTPLRSISNERSKLEELPTVEQISEFLNRFKSLARSNNQLLLSSCFPQSAIPAQMSRLKCEIIGGLIFSQWLANTKPELHNFPGLELIVHTGVELARRSYQPQEAELNFVEFFCMLYLLFRQLESEIATIRADFAVLSLGESFRLADLSDSFCESFLTKGRIDLSDYIKTIQKLVPIKGAASLEQNIQKVQVSLELSLRQLAKHRFPSEADRVHSEALLSAHHRLVSLLLELLRDKESAHPLSTEFSQEIALNADHNNFGTLGIKILSRWMQCREVDNLTTNQILRHCWGTLLELETLEPGVHFKAICQILMLLIQKQINPMTQLEFPSTQEIFGMTQLAKLIVQSYKSQSSTNPELSLTKFSPDQQRFFYLQLNLKMMCIALNKPEEFSLMSQEGRIPSDTILFCLQQIDTLFRQQSLLITKEQVVAFCTFRTVVMLVKENNSPQLHSLATPLDQQYRNSWVDGESNLQQQPILGLFLLHTLYNEIPGLNTLRERGLVFMQEVLIKNRNKVQTHFMIPSESRQRDAFSQIELLCSRSIDFGASFTGTQVLDTLLHASNMLIATPPGSNEIRNLKQNLSSKLFGQYWSITIEHQQRGSVNPSLNSSMLAGISVVFAFLEAVPSATTYSNNHQSSHPASNFDPMINYPVPKLLKWLPLNDFAEKTNSRTVAYQRREIGAVWECTTPDCTGIIAMGNCGGLGHAGEQGISTKCPECKKPIGRLGNSQDPGLRKVTLDQVNRECKALLAVDEKPFRRQPLNSRQTQRFDESWILMKYLAEIPNRTTAIFISLMQNIIYFAKENLTLNIRERFSKSIPSRNGRETETETEQLILKEFTLLGEVLGKEAQGVFEVICLVLLRVMDKISTNPQSVPTPASMRKDLSEAFQYVALPGPNNSPPKGLEEYYLIKSGRIQNNNGNSKLMDLLSGRMPLKEMKEIYKGQEQKILGFLINKIQSRISLEDVITRLAEIQRVPANAQLLLKCAFLENLVGKAGEFQLFRHAIFGVKRFAIFLAEMFDSKLTKKEGAEKSIGELIRQDTTDRLRTEFTTFVRLINQDIRGNSVIQDHIEAYFGLDCQQVRNAMEHIKALTLESTSLNYFLIYEDRSPEDATPYLQMLLEVLLKMQENWINNYSQLCRSRPTESFVSRSFFSADDRALISLQSNFEADLIGHSYMEACSTTTSGTLLVDIDFLAHKYAEQLFSQAQLLKVCPNFSFRDSPKNELTYLVRRLWVVYPALQREADASVVVHVSENPQDVVCLQNMLRLAMCRILKGDAALRVTSNTVISEVLPNILSATDTVTGTLARIRLKDLDIICKRLSILGFDALMRNIQTKVTIQRTPARFADNPQVRSKLTAATLVTRRQWVDIAKLCFVTPISRVAALESAVIGMQLNSNAMDALEEDLEVSLQGLLRELSLDAEEIRVKDLLDMITVLESN